ncbi:hypothetical protein DICPUDRAFT_149324 [Dictyostelium purpureum]|uniref:Uncharacterized protein n=1 Tax=Dictyostelium purpureum TaxID=5786 RepID=F0ZDE4_DICPU|nr:uncharacterized protein DICPUDRAFT_149324 [Dictyostelium purpureum]EGC38027.1 hypothetical protein DICPUDRAFT_149324 [Dictyostelium purpureum]|eukprot:XP_003285428.1 hypothetical protein DICPUDRAFT_149324 [Dictyostelium purpureum]
MSNNNNNNNSNIFSSSNTSIDYSVVASPPSSWSPVYHPSSKDVLSNSSQNNNNNSYANMMIESYESSLVPNICPDAPNNYTSYLIGLYHHNSFEGKEQDSMLCSSPNDNDADINNYGSMFELIKNSPLNLSHCGAQTVPSL